MVRPTEPCFACKGNDFWLRDDGGWACGKCHPDPGKHPHCVIGNLEDEFKTMQERVRLGNEKLWRAWQQIKELADDKAEWSRQMDLWAQAKEKLWGLVEELRQRYNFYDCLYLENGKKIRGCLHNDDGFFCQVCPCRPGNPYWEKELTDLPSGGK